MSLNDIYTAHLLDHSKHPRRFGELDNPDVSQDGLNANCGDELHVQIKAENGVINDVMFTGKACAICLGAASMFAESAYGAKFSELDNLKDKVYRMLHGEKLSDAELKEMGDHAALAGVAKLPARVKCATLVWETWTLIEKSLKQKT